MIRVRNKLQIRVYKYSQWKYVFARFSWTIQPDLAVNETAILYQLLANPGVRGSTRRDPPRALRDVSGGMVNRSRDLLKPVPSFTWMELVLVDGKTTPEVSSNVHQRNLSKRTCELLAKNTPLSFQS